MSLAAGSRIGHYEIVAPLGAGGMGEVYRARDSKLKREVALKVLPAEVAGDRERLARFEREGHILASVNHPNIAAIHGLAESESGPVLVLELVDGLTLQDRLASGPLALDEALSIARQIADALEAAHEQGVVHRDLKPANIKIRSDGTVKVLDFGIAKILDRAGHPRAVDLTTASLTEPGVVIGTTSYMSPEQVRGAEVTRRSDVWAFGAVLFEMLTGKRPFTGPTTSDVLAAILQQTPDLSALPPATPSAIARLVRRCLERDPKARLHDIGDARLEIEDAERSLRGEQPVQAQAAQRIGPGDLAGRNTLRWAVILGVASLALAAYLFSPAREGARQEIRLQLSPPTGMRFVSVPAVSPDGSRIVFAAVAHAGGAARLWLRPFAATVPTPLPGTEGASYPFWSADSRFIGFFADGKLKRVAIAAGNPVMVCDAPAGRGGLWLDDDTIVFAPLASSPLVRINAAGGSPMPFTALADDETGHRFPQRLPGRQLLYFSVNRAPEKSGSRLITIDDPHRAIAYVETQGAAEYVNGFLLLVPDSVGGPVLAQRMTLPGGQLTGEPFEIGQTRVSETLGRHVMASSPTGVIAMLGPFDAVGQFTWISRDGRPLHTVGEPAGQLGVELSPDGQHVATLRSREIWTMSLARPVPTRVTREGPNRYPIWSPDGAHILSLFQGRGIGTFDLVTTSVATGDVEVVRQQTSAALKPGGWTRDGRLVWLEYAADNPGRSIWTRPTNGQPVPVLRDGAAETPRVSPDGRWIAYASDRSGRFEIEVTSFPEPGRRYPVSVEGGGYPRWRSDGRELYFLSANARLMAASFAAGTPPAIGTPAPLFEVRLIASPNSGIFTTYEYDVNADGSRFLINRLVSLPDESMTVIVDWNPPR